MSTLPYFPAGLARRSASPAVLAALLASATATLVTPSTVQAQTVLHACYVPASGTVYRIKAVNTPANCLQPTHVAFSWTDGAEAAASLMNAVKKTDVAAGDVTGVFSNLTVGKLLGRALATTPPTDGQVLAWNATTNTWEPKAVAAGGGGGGVSDHGVLAGLGDDDHAQYLLSQGVRNSATGFAVRSVVEVNAPSPLPSTPNGESGLMWHGTRGAFRVGSNTVSAYDWSNSNVGIYSFAYGDLVKASGYASFAGGQEAIASGQYAVALGLGAVASATSSVALGQGSTATGFNATAVAAGTASGIGSFAAGGTASGEQSVAFGNGGASGFRSFAFGDASATAARSVAIGNGAVSNKIGAMTLADASLPSVQSAADNRFTARFVGGYSLFTNTALTTGCSIATGGGSWSCTSDRNTKTALAAVDGESVLTKLGTLPISTWEYQTERGARHLGPMAQDFRAAFGLGSDEKSIGVLDASGVALAAAQALEARTRSLKAETLALRQENAELAARLAQLEALVAQLSGTSRNR